MSLEDVKVGRCDFKQYEHCGPHEQIGEYGQRLPPFACKNWRPDEAAAREREQAREEKRLRLHNACSMALRFPFTPFPDRYEFEYDGHRYEIREVEGNKR